MFLDQLTTSLTGPGVIAISGGPDSVALAHACVQSKTAPIVLAHVNHQLRGPESDADEEFVRRFAETMGVPCVTTRIAVAAIAERERDNLESIARRERYAWLAQVAKDQGAKWIATGHTANDQAETVLFRLLRGAGIVGLRGIARRRTLAEGIELVRPLLNVRRQVLLDYLSENNIAFRTDSSNRDLRYSRNHIRHELLPLLAGQYNTGIVDVLCRLAEQADEVATQITKEADALLGEAELPRAGSMLIFSIARLQQASPNLVREMFRRVWLREHWPTGSMDFAHWQRLIHILFGAESACDFPDGVHVERSEKVMRVQQRFCH